MAVTFVRDSGNNSADRDTSASSASVRYLVTADSPSEIVPAVILGNPGAVTNGSETLPTIGSAHPDNPLMKLDNYASTFDGAVLELVAQYSSDGRYRFPTNGNPPSSDTDQRWSVTFDFAQYDIPYVRKVPVSNSGTTVADIYAFDTVKVTEKTQRNSVTALLPSARFQEAINVLFKQKNVIHRVNGDAWLFEGGDLTPTANDRNYYTATLSWLLQTGTPTLDAGAIVTGGTTPGLTGSTRIEFPSLASWFYPNNSNYSRPPFVNVYYELPSSGDQTTLGTFLQSYQYPFDANGFNTIAALFAAPLNPGALPP